MKKTVKLTQSELNRMINEAVKKVLNEYDNLSLEDEMKIWQERANDEFCQILKKIERIFIDMFGEHESEYGIKYSALSDIISYYVGNGNRKYTANNIYRTLENYDMLNNGDKKLDALVSKMMNLAKSQE